MKLSIFVSVEFPHSEIKYPKDNSALSEKSSATMTAKSPHNSSPRGAIIPENEAGSFKQNKRNITKNLQLITPSAEKETDILICDVFVFYPWYTNT